MDMHIVKNCIFTSNDEVYINYRINLLRTTLHTLHCHTLHYFHLL